MKSFLLIVCLFLGLHSLRAQCPTAGSTVNLTSQALVDAFPTTYSGCTSITNNAMIIVTGPDITNLTGLSALTYIGGALIIKDNPMLADLSELSALTSIGGNGGYLEIMDNSALTSVTGLEALNSVNSSITIKNNDALVDLSGFNNISYAFGSGSLTIEDNAELTSIQGLSTITTQMSTMSITGNPKLTSLNGLHNIVTSVAQITIENNALLADVNMSALRISFGPVIIKNNPALTNMNGLSNLDTISSPGLEISFNNTLTDVSGLTIESLVGGLQIESNAILTNLTGFETLTSLNNNQLSILSNPLLTNIDGVKNILASTFSGVTITNNSVLSTCNVTSICAYLETTSPNATISGNATGCATIPEVEAACMPAGCPMQGDIVNLTSQALVDAFPTTYGGCTSITNNAMIIVNGPDITNLTGLSALTYIGGTLIIKDNPLLTDLSELSALTSIGGNGGYLSIDNNATLASLAGLENIISINTKIEVINNPLLVNLDGLVNATYAFGYGELVVVNNAILNSISAIDGVGTNIGIINIVNNPLLTTLNGLENITTTGAYIHIEDNANLTDISLNSLFKIWGDLSIKNNDALINLNGLSSLDTIQSNGLYIQDNALLADISSFTLNYLKGNLLIKNNAILSNLTGLESLTSIHNNSINIESNPLLTNIDGVKNIMASTISGLTITNNAQLSTCHITSVCDYIDLPGNNTTINNNLSGCNTVNEVQIACSPCPTVTLTFDEPDTTLCLGEDVVLTASMTGATAYLWSTGETTNSITKTPTITTTYSVTVTGSNGCTNSASQIINVNPLPTATITTDEADNTLCIGEDVVLTASGGISYVWSTGETTATNTQSPMSTTTYTVTATDSNGCTNTADQLITVNPLPIATITTDEPDNTLCFGEDVVLTASGGVSYVWSTGETTAANTQSPTSTTTYTVSVTDSNGCTNTASQIITVNPLPTAIIMTDEADNTLCLGEDVVLTASGGLSYVWSTGETTAINTQSPTTTTTYTVTITDNNGCTNTADQIITVDPLPTVIITTDEPDNTLCLGEDVVLTASGGVSYIWSTGETTNSITQTPTSTTTYSVTATDSNGCTNTAEQIITVNPLPTASIVTDEIDNALCLGEDVVLIAIGGVSYVWSTGETTNLITQSPMSTTTYSVTVTDSNGCTNTADQLITVDPLPTVIITTDEVDNTLCLGEDVVLTASGGVSYIWSTGETTNSITQTPTSTTTYIVTVTDSNGCTNSEQQIITVDPLPNVIITTDEADNTLCLGEDVVLTASGGVSYIWSTGETTNSITQTPTSTTTYSVTATDSNGCTNTAEQIITVNPLPTASIVTDEIDNTLCLGEDVVLIAIGGVSYVWSTGETTNLITQSPMSTTTYIVTVTDSNGCTNTADQLITVISSPTAIITTDEVDNTLCLGEDVVLTVSGGVSYVWSTGGTTNSITQSPSNTTTYSVTVTGSNSCTNTTEQIITVNPLPTVIITTDEADNTLCLGEDVVLTAIGGVSYVWSTGETTAANTQTPTSTTTYSVTVTDSNDCTNTTEQIITVDPLPTALVTTDEADNTLCLGEDVVLTASGGVSYVWSTGETTAANTQSPMSTTTYIVTVTDSNGCTNTADQLITVDPLPTVIITTDELDNTLCLGEDVVLTASSGVSYVWSTGETTAANTQSPINTTTYSVTVTDSNGCTNTAEQIITVIQLPAAMIMTDEPDNTICVGEDVMLIASGGQSYLWNTGETTASITTSPTVTTTYMVTVTGANICSDEPSITIIVNPLPDAIITSDEADNALCLGEDVVLTTSGGASYLWNTGETSVSVTQNPTIATTYFVTITDTNGCVNTAMQFIEVNTLPTATITTDEPDSTLCVGEDIVLTASGGVSYSWSTGETTAVITQSPTSNTTYMVTISDTNGCTDDAAQLILTNNLPPAMIMTDDPDNAICIGEDIELTASGGTGFLWNTGETTAMITKTLLTNSTFNVTVTDNNGCTNMSSQNIVVNKLPNVNIEAPSVLCSGNDLIVIENGGEATTWQWSFDGEIKGTNDSLLIAPGTLVNPKIYVEVQNASQCSSKDSVVLNIVSSTNFEPIFLIPSSGCSGDSIKMIEHSDISFVPTKVVWNFGDGETSSELYPVHIYQNPGTFSVNVEVFENECSKVTITKDINILSCRKGEEQEQNVLSISSNPIFSNTSFDLIFQTEFKQSVSYIVANMTGGIEYQGSFENDRHNTVTIDGLEPGIYIVQAIWPFSKEKQTQKLLVIR